MEVTSFLETNPSMNVSYHIDAYLDHLREDRALADRTIQSYGQELRLFARVIGQEYKVKKIARGEVIAFLGRPGPRGKMPGPAARNRKLIVLRGFFGYLAGRGHIETAPTAGIQWARVPRAERPYLAAADHRKLLKAVGEVSPAWRRNRDRALIQTLFHTGIRVTELVGITLDQVDLVGAVLTDLHRKGGADQTLPLNRMVVDELQRWLAVRELRSPRGTKLFIGRAGQGLSVRQVERLMKVFGEQAGIPFPVTPHVLRHTHGAELVRAGVNLEVIKRLLNHQSITTTSRYSHVGFDAMREAVERLVEEEG